MNVQEFGKLAGVTVRALHHYDRLGLLRPQRTDAGYRVYSTRDLERLEQIVALKFLGIPLKQIKGMLDLNGLELPDALRMQRTVLEQKRKLLDRAILAIREAEQSIGPGRRADSALLTKIIEVIEMQNDSSWSEKYYSPEARAKIDERRKEWTPELQAQVSKQWTELFADVEAALGEDPESEKAQALAVRWKALVAGFTGGDPEIGEGLNKLYADKANWPAPAKEQMAPFGNPKVWEYMSRVMKCGG
ncbi:MAG: transcriptional regulator, MerR family [Candidatus Solibacter sp.]|nr:transcriptional regulator, MerR family [Candidatus Solibacter sp.]